VFVGARLRGLLDGAENSKRSLTAGFVLPEEELLLLELLLADGAGLCDEPPPPPPPPLPQLAKLKHSKNKNGNSEESERDRIGIHASVAEKF
jgi:hypothetical protein